MKRIVLAVASAALVGLTACSGGGAPGAVLGNAPVPVSCSQKYQTWAHGQGAGLVTTIHEFSVAVATGDSQALTVALRKAKPTVVRASRYPVPACADPRGYWSVLLMHVNAAVGGNQSASSVHAALKDVPAIEQELTAELPSTSPVN